MIVLPENAPRRWVPSLLLAAAVVLVPWTIALGWRLPAEHTSHHWDAAWVGFDIAEAVALGATGYALARRRLWLQTAAGVAAALLLTDAWFDNILANGGTEHLEAALEAAVGELPLALICLWAARNGEHAVAAVVAARDRLRRRRE